MSILPRRTVTAKEPIDVMEIRKFAENAEVGDEVLALLPFKKWTSTVNFNIYYKPVKVTIKGKYPYLVETDYGIFTWNEMVIGYYEYGEAGDDFTMKTPAVKNKSVVRQKAA